MAEEIHYPETGTRTERYSQLLPQIEALISPEADLIANLSNVAAVLKSGFGFFWVGFYLEKDGGLILGPFQGPVACTRISFDRGVCGAAASRQETVVVPDVSQFPGYIACDNETQSEIVVPMVVKGLVKMVLDVDSDQLDDFGDEDVAGLEAICALLARHHFPG